MNPRKKQEKQKEAEKKEKVDKELLTASKEDHKNKLKKQQTVFKNGKDIH